MIGFLFLRDPPKISRHMTKSSFFVSCYTSKFAIMTRSHFLHLRKLTYIDSTDHPINFILLIFSYLGIITFIQSTFDTDTTKIFHINEPMNEEHYVD